METTLVTRTNLTGNRGAVFSPCEAYRYRLWETWDENKPALTFLMLNPSTADEFANDPTIARCQKRALTSGFGAVEIINLFALRSTDPNQLYTHANPVGDANDEAIRTAATTSGMLVAAWGKHGALNNRATHVLGILSSINKPLHALKLNADGSPAHPLYISLNAQPFTVNLR